MFFFAFYFHSPSPALFFSFSFPLFCHFFPLLRLFVCVRISQPAPAPAPSSAFGSFVVVVAVAVAVAIVLTLSLRQVSNVAEWPTPSSSSLPSPAVSGSLLSTTLRTLHSPFSTLSTFRGVYLRWRQSVSSPGVAPVPVPSSPLQPTLFYFATFSVCFALFAASACPPCPLSPHCLPCGSPTSSAHKFYLYIFRYFATFLCCCCCCAYLMKLFIFLVCVCVCGIGSECVW